MFTLQKGEEFSADHERKNAQQVLSMSGTQIVSILFLQLFYVAGQKNAFRGFHWSQNAIFP